MVRLIKNKDKRGLSGGSNELVARVKNYVVRNLGAPFILIFDAIILAVAFMSLNGNTFVNELAVLAYCFLVIGVILQAICYIRYK